MLLDVPVYDVHSGHHEGLLLQPVRIPTDFPLAQILHLDGLAAEVAGEDGLDFREAVQPRNELDAYEFAPAYRDKAGAILKIVYYANPAGSRNLEFDPQKVIKSTP